MTLREILETWEPGREVSLLWLWESPGGYHYDTIRGEWIQGHGREARSTDAGQGQPDFRPDLPQIDPEYCYSGPVSGLEEYLRLYDCWADLDADLTGPTAEFWKKDPEGLANDPDDRQQSIPRGSFVVLHDVPDGILY